MKQWLSVVCVLSLAASAGPRDSIFNPGLMGPNAIPTLPVPSPWPAQRIRSGIGLAVQRATSNGGVDWSLTVPLYAAFPVGDRVEIGADGSPLEAFWVSSQTVNAWSLARSNGVVQADTRLFTKVLLLKGEGWWPALAARIALKTTTGKGRGERRFLDAPGYAIDLPFAKRFQLGSTTRLEVGGLIGFLAWQQPDKAQNDAYEYGVRAALQGHRLSGTLELRGAIGWQRHDHPLTVVLSGEVMLHRDVGLVASLLQNLNDPPYSEASIGVRFELDSPFVTRAPSTQE